MSAVYVLAACSSDVRRPEASTACDDCVVLDSVTTLDVSDLDFIPSPLGLLSRDPAGERWAFVDRRFNTRIVRFAPDGIAEIGRPGDGPGEFRQIDDIRFDASGELVVLHDGGHRVRRYGTDLRLIEEWPTPGRVRSVRPLSNGRLFIVSSDARGVQAGIWIPDSTFRPAPVNLASADPLLVLAESNLHGDVWLVEPHAFRIWSISDNLEPRLLADTTPAWFQERYGQDVAERLETVGADTGGATALSIRHDARENLLWVVFAVPSSDLTVEVVDRILAGESELVSQMASHMVVAVSTSDGAIRAAKRFDDLALAAGTTWMYELVGDDRIVIRAPRLHSR